MNPYDVLGVSPDASDEEIARAYKRLAKRHHPDLNPDDAAAAERMGRINRAYEEIRSLRQQGGEEAYGTGQGGYAGPFGPSTAGRAYYRAYRPPQHSPIGMLIAVLVTFLLVRFILSLLFGGYGSNSYYPAPGGYPGGPGYSHSQSVPPD